MRSALSACTPIYRGAVAMRNFWYDHVPRAIRRAGLPVISIGNITTGGTGKTPMTAWVALRLAAAGHSVGILTRGYAGTRKTQRSTTADAAAPRTRVISDEVEVLRRLCPEARIVIDADRVAGARRAVQQRCGVLVMDDGFQHRRLHRDLDIVLIDATSPFGHGRLLPRGLLREPPRALRRAHVIVVTREDQIAPSDRETLMAALRDLAPDRPIVAARYAVTGWCDVRGREAAAGEAGAMNALVLAGIANFGAFRSMLEGLGVHVLAAYEFPDHHDYTDAEIAELPHIAEQIEANILLTTEKDAVKLVDRWPEGPMPLIAPRIEMRFDDADSSIVDAALQRACST